MYFKLSLRNAKRSIFDYLLYIATMTILIGILCVSNCFAVLGNRQAGFQTASLPVLIVLIMVALVNYINTFMLRQRAKELANYMLLGMEKGKLTQMFLLEFCCIGIVCFILGVLLGTGIYAAVFPHSFYDARIKWEDILVSVFYTFLFFVLVQVLSAIRMKRRIYRLEIRELMEENRRNQPIKGNRKTFWGILFVVFFVAALLLLWGMVYLPESIGFSLVSFMAIPLLGCIFSFYQWVYGSFSAKRLLQPESLYTNNRLYLLAELTTQARTNPLMNSIFCTCLFFAATSFVFGGFMLRPDIGVFDRDDQQWMGFLQICLCIIGMVIYFSVLSLQQVIQLKRQANNIRILHYMGKSRRQIKFMIKAQILLALFLPTAMCFILLAIGTPLINVKTNEIFPLFMHNLLLKYVGGFVVCFAMLYLCYFLIVYTISKRYLKNVLNTL